MSITLKKITIFLSTLFVALTALAAMSAAHPLQTNGAMLIKRGTGEQTAMGVSVPSLAQTTITNDVPDLRTIEYNDNILYIKLLGNVQAAAVYTDINYQGRCETVTHFAPRNWVPSNTVGTGISSIRLNYTCIGPTGSTPVITDVNTVSGSSADIQCESGFTRKSQDINAGGGAYVYLCLQYGPMGGKYVGGLSYGDGSKNAPACSGAAYHWTGDLKAGTKKSGLYMCVDRSGGESFSDVDFVAKDSPLNPFSGERPCEAKLGLPSLRVLQGDDDLNQGLGGKYIYRCIGLSRERER